VQQLGINPDLIAFTMRYHVVLRASFMAHEK
jgi:hypothetical protein